MRNLGFTKIGHGYYSLCVIFLFHRHSGSERMSNGPLHPTTSSLGLCSARNDARGLSRTGNARSRKFTCALVFWCKVQDESYLWSVPTGMNAFTAQDLFELAFIHFIYSNVEPRHLYHCFETSKHLTHSPLRCFSSFRISSTPKVRLPTDFSCQSSWNIRTSPRESQTLQTKLF